MAFCTDEMGPSADNKKNDNGKKPILHDPPPMRIVRKPQI